jgi:transcription-repair coupling factor (superfamily II helicase)
MTPAPELFRPVLEASWFREAERRLRRGETGVALVGLVESARSLVLTLLGRHVEIGLLVVVPDDRALEAYHRDLLAIAEMAGRDPRRVVVFPAMDADPYDNIPAHPEVIRDRVVALGRLLRRDLDVLLVPARALLGWLPSREEVASRSTVLHRGDPLAPDRFVLDAMRAGYRRVEIVSAPGEVSRRGGIVDIFPPEAEEPVRLELFGESVESLRAFDTDHQRSTRILDEAVVGPASENPASDEAVARLARHLESGAMRARDLDEPVRPFRERLEELQQQGYLPGMEALGAITSTKPTLLLEHAAGMALVVDEPGKVEDEIVRAAHDAKRSHEESGDRILPPPDVLFADTTAVRGKLRQAPLLLQELAGEVPPGARTELRAVSRTARAYTGRIPELVADLRAARERGATTLCVMRSAGSADRLAEILEEYELPLSGGLFVLRAPLRAGFELPEQAFGVLAEREIFGDEVRPVERRAKTRAAFLSDFRDLKVGDLIVHVDHGVARYAGLGRPKGGSLNRDFMVLEFSGGDRLFVPEDRLDVVQKYSGVAGHKPALDRLGGPGWDRLKAKVRKSVESMAKELLELYARRKATPGTAFSPDTQWQRELEAAFPYEPTPDQARALEETKRDMESTEAMDRLIVGDVGFGKTEVAVRAAFKAVMDGYQVAVLTPTTVLAVQHAETFRERFAPFPTRVEMVSRFRAAAETRQVLRDVAAGNVDVLIGTHRLLSKDVAFRKLGLLVVDEEQRFGVAHKERLKRLSLGVDVLSMTATPIPRTLQMSLAGVRDLSIIETPPRGRTAIETYLIPFRKNVIAQAIRQELRRGGQVFVVHNRIETLPAMARAIRDMVPDARLVVAHGKMGERELEKVMLQFVHHEADILVTTTIIENGLDIPRANTIIVNRADRFGLAQLYQLRGRVGRSEQHAYAYFITPGRQATSDLARRRLRALQEFSELGSGFRLAAADLEIRGAGEFLGSRQHGHIAALGFDLYCQMLERAVADLKGEPQVERTPASLHLGIDIKLPESYMPEVGDRLALYKRLSIARDERDVDRLQTETEDRSGHLPPAGANLFELARVRLLAEIAGVKSVDVANAQLQIRFTPASPIDPSRLVEILARERGSITPSGLVLLPAPEKASERIRAVRDVLERALGKVTT